MILGDVQILYIKRGGTFYPVGCLTENGLSESTDVIEGNTSTLNGWSDIRLGNQSYEINATAVLDERDAIFSYADLVNYKRGRVLIDWRVSDGVNESDGKGYITEISDTANIDEFINFTFKINGFGAIV